MSSKKNSRLWARLRVLCCSGLDAMSIAPDAFAIVHELIPNAASALFLTAHDGEQQATFHEDCPPAVQALCGSEADLFSGPEEPSFRRLIGTQSTPKVGQLLDPPPRYFSSNTYQLLVRGCGHHHTLDARLEVDGRRFGLLALFREPGLNYGAQDVENISRLALYFEHAIRAGAQSDSDTDGIVEQEALIIANTDGELLYLGGVARVLLDEVPLVRSQWPDRRRLPPVCERLIDILRDNDRYPWKMPSCTLPVVGGSLEISAQWLGSAGDTPGDVALAGADGGLIGITLKRRVPAPLRIWRNLKDMPLSPQQMEVAFWMALGGGRDAVRARMAISEAVLRDCVKAIYEKLGCASQGEVANALRSTPGQAQATTSF